MNTVILEAEELTGAGEIEHHVGKADIYHQHSLRRTPVEIEEKMQGSYGELSARMQTLIDSLPQGDELACFDTQLELYERHLDDMKRVANAWATGNARDIESYSRLGEMDDPCTRLLFASSEGGYLEKLIDQSSRRWLDAGRYRAGSQPHHLRHVAHGPHCGRPLADRRARDPGSCNSCTAVKSMANRRDCNRTGRCPV